MRDVIVMWRSTKMAVLAALCAGVYAALLIPFKAIPLIPGVTEIRPANVVPVVAGMLFGPAAAWGSAFGNLIGDFFGTLGPGSFFGFVGNFLYAYVPYRIYRFLSRGRPATGEPSGAPLFILATVIGSMSCAVVIAWGVDLLGMVPYHVLAALITLNNAIAGVVLGLLVLPLLYPRARRWGLIYDDVLAPDDYTEGAAAPLGVVLVSAASLYGALMALSIFLGGESGPLLKLLPAQIQPGTAGAVCVLLIIIGCTLFTRSTPRERGTALGAGATWQQTSEQALVVHDVAFTYALAEHRALDGVTLRQDSRHLRMLMGATGAGKSTLCKCLNGVIPELQTGDFAGHVRLFGSDIAGVPVHALTPVIGELFQDFESQLVTSSVEGEVALPLENTGVPREEMHQRVREALEAVDMWPLRQRDPILLSGGQKQRVALAAVLVTRPSIVVLDEPTTDLDPRGKRELLHQCDKLRAAGNALVIAEHETELAVDADILTVIAHGQIAYDGPPAALLRDPDRTERLGLRPLDMPALFAAIGRPERPLTVDEAEHLLRGARFDDQAWQDLAAVGPPDSVTHTHQETRGPVLSARGVGYTYPGAVEAIKSLSLEVHNGEFVVILGENGSGKTTLAKLLGGLLEPTEGCVEVAGQDTRTAPLADLATTVGYLFQDPDHQIFAETVYDEVAFGTRNMGLAADAVEERVGKALAAVGLEGERATDPFVLTKGERQQVALASILAMRPRVIIFDEPTTGLDGPQQRLMMERLRQLNLEGHTIVVITHCSWAAAECPYRAIVLHDGSLIADATVREVHGDEALLARAGQKAPQVTELGQRLFGKTFLSVAEAAACLEGGAAR